ncbi:class IIb bacteriocin, lactobin A/cerein 7B family, partial [Streptococcus sp. 202]
TEEELMDVDGGALPLVIAGVSIWKIGAAVAGGAAALFAGGAALGYYANRP